MKSNSTTVHPTALVDPKAQLGVGVSVGPYTIIGPDATIEDHVQIESHAHITGKTTIGAHSRVWPFATLGSQPQDLKYAGENSELICGSHNMFREYCNISIGTNGGGGLTRIGSHNLFMIHSHIAHDCMIGNHCIFSAGVSLAGHVEVGDYACVAGHSACHQFVNIGKHAFVGAFSLVTKDVAPYVTVHGNHATLKGLNLTGIKRRGLNKDEIETIKYIYKTLFMKNLTVEEALKTIETKYSTQNLYVKDFVDFLKDSSRGLCRKPASKIAEVGMSRERSSSQASEAKTPSHHPSN